MSTPYFTIFIPTYNRANLLPRTFASIERQTFRDFEVVIVDDGSTDNTSELVETWRTRQSFQVTYHFQPNQGRHVAFNKGVELARGQLFVNLDSDDQLMPNALECLLRHWESIPVDARTNFAGVEGLISINGCVRNKHFFPSDVFDSNYLDIRIRLKIGGDKKSALLTEILRHYPYPVFSGERHIRPSLIWKRIAKKYQTRYINEIIQDCEYQPDGLSSNRFSLRMRNPRGYAFYYYEDITLHRSSYDWRQSSRNTIEYIRFSLHANYPLHEQASVLHGRALAMWLLLFPAGVIRWLHDHYRIYLLNKPVNRR